MRHKLSLTVSAVFALFSLGACGPKFGDGCKNSTDCSVRNDRICDRSQPGGYCTIANCKPGDCGDDGVCVRFRPAEPRLSTSYCMAKCDSNSDCDRDAYVCKSADRLNDDMAQKLNDELAEDFAEVLDGSGRSKFCVAREE
jgi:hypothetical protein